MNVSADALLNSIADGAFRLRSYKTDSDASHPEVPMLLEEIDSLVWSLVDMIEDGDV